MNYFIDYNATGAPVFTKAGAAVLALLIIWELAWKGYGLWRAARNNQVGWFVAMLLLNTVGILPILYLYVFSPKDSR